ncbi:ChuX/HutX family heme-like substrate-binding protein [Geothrix sp. 21YS21S-4]|uniref:ChuX/HutX family heme-like substrate-binding protein n=1 Tax=Geothrix sp. 21YS21S-4 TaxID=3068889 RepID=UPI0027B99F68|nr:ChuX/HutX family heme-like substrate-binding protein [Geothrix sp. 21YS21S-4]
MLSEGNWIGSFTAGEARSREGGPSDLEALHAREDIRLMPLQRNARGLLLDLPSLGRVDYTTRNACVTCTRREAVKVVLPGDEGATLFGDASGLRWLDASWRHTVAVLSRTMDFTDTPPCLLLFGEGGDLAHQVTLPDPAAWEAFITLVRRHHGCWNCLRHRPAAAGPVVPKSLDCPVWMLREAWSQAESDRDLEVRLDGLGIDRLLALRAMEGLYTHLVPRHDLAGFLQGLADAGLPVHAQVGNRHCTQVLESPVEELVLGSQGWTFRMGDAALELDPSRLDGIWSVTQPTPSGERHRLECYDAAGERVLAFASPQAPDALARLGWQRLLGRLDGLSF